jgi:hypothetical protein
LSFGDKIGSFADKVLDGHTQAGIISSMLRPFVLATAVCGTLDILFAVLLTLWRDREPTDMLRFVASGPFPQATEWGASGSVLGLVVHFALMALMVAAFVLAASNFPVLVDKPLLWGLVFGLVTYAAMNLIVVPLRFPAAWPPKALAIGTQLFAHIALVGWPTAFITRGFLRG